MSDKNLDVDRAIASVGGENWVYHSFKPVMTEAAKTRLSSSFTYNEFGEPEYKAPHLPLPAPSQYAAPDDEYLEDAAYPETHPGEVWDDVPAPEDHTARFIAPAPLPVAVNPSPFPFPSAPARSTPPGGAAPGLARPAYVPFLPSTLPQSVVQASARLYRPAERAAPEAPVSVNAPAPAGPPSYVPAQVSRAPAPPPIPVSPPIAAPSVAAPSVAAPPVAAAAAMIAPAPVPPAAMAPSTVYRPGAAPAAPRPFIGMIAAPLPETTAAAPVPLPLPASLVVPAPVSQHLAERAAAPAVRAPASASRAPLTTPYPQPFGTLADMYARLAIHAVPTPEAPEVAPAIDTSEQKMFRRI